MRGRVMKPFTGPHTFSLISAPLRDNPAPNGSELRLTIDRSCRSEEDRHASTTPRLTSVLATVDYGDRRGEVIAN